MEEGLSSSRLDFVEDLFSKHSGFLKRSELFWAQEVCRHIENTLEVKSRGCGR